MAQVAEISEIAAPARAVAGSRVDIRVTLKNKASVTAGIMIGGILHPVGTHINFPLDWANFPPGVAYYFDGYFTMPSSGITLYLNSYYYGEQGAWVPDDFKTKSVGLEALVPVFSQFQISDYRAV